MAKDFIFLFKKSCLVIFLTFVLINGSFAMERIPEEKAGVGWSEEARSFRDKRPRDINVSLRENKKLNTYPDSPTSGFFPDPNSPTVNSPSFNSLQNFTTPPSTPSCFSYANVICRNLKVLYRQNSGLFHCLVEIILTGDLTSRWVINLSERDLENLIENRLYDLAQNKIPEAVVSFVKNNSEAVKKIPTLIDINELFENNGTDLEALCKEIESISFLDDQKEE